MGNQLPHPVTNKSVHCGGNRHFKVACASMNGMREAMEDDHVIVVNENYGLFGVFDGHCGSSCSSFCAKTLPGEVAASGMPPLDKKVIEEITLGLDRKFRAEMKAEVVNVGDSRIIVGRKMGKTCIPMTTDHKPSREDERLRIEECGGTVLMDRVDGSLAMSRAIGDYEFKQGTGGDLKQKVIALPEVTSLLCDRDDFVFIACDGIFESNFTNEEVIEFLREIFTKDPNDLIGACCAVADEALRRGSGDNITCLLLCFRDGSGYASKQLLPGRFYPNEPTFAKAYIATLQGYKLSLGQALELRYDIIRKKTAQLKKEQSSSKGSGSELSELSQLTDELALYKPGPDMNMTAVERSKYFQKLADSIGSVAEDSARGEAGDSVGEVDELVMQQMIDILKAKGRIGGNASESIGESSNHGTGIGGAVPGGNRSVYGGPDKIPKKADGGKAAAARSSSTSISTTGSNSARSAKVPAKAKPTPRGMGSTSNIKKR